MSFYTDFFSFLVPFIPKRPSSVWILYAKTSSAPVLKYNWKCKISKLKIVFFKNSQKNFIRNNWISVYMHVKQFLPFNPFVELYLIPNNDDTLLRGYFWAFYVCAQKKGFKDDQDIIKIQNIFTDPFDRS